MFEIVTLIVTPFQQNARILGCGESRQAVVVDPGGEVERIMEALGRRSYTLSEVWLTHAHLDHCGGVAELIERTGAKLVAHAGERELRANVESIAKMYGLPLDGMKNCPEPDRVIAGGDSVLLADYRFDVLFTPGHSPGHVCFYHKDSGTLLAGDTLFAGSIGRTDLPGGSYNTLMLSIRDQILPLPDDTVVLPGHGPDTTVGVERRGNPFVVGLENA